MPRNWSGKFYLVFYVLCILLLVVAGVAVQTKIEQDKSRAYWESVESEIARQNAREDWVRKNAEYIRCMATNIYHEAAAEPFMGQVAVARVVVNRINHGFASNPCRVIYQKTVVRDSSRPGGARILCQFSWVCQGKGEPKINSNAYRQAEEIATKVLYEDGWGDAVPQNVLFFHSTAVNPAWGYERAMQIGNHIFYKK